MFVKGARDAIARERGVEGSRAPEIIRMTRLKKMNRTPYRTYNSYSYSCSFALMPKNQKIKAAVYFGNYHGSLAIFWKGGLPHKMV
ncbi:hypothetical protein [Leeuwenhoekiella marinoflava]|uniref:hypothetical protein n=1 Tax=Leeuwenhoekiella marinoflava TaxID=988 RepID=UPI000934C794|nr:hypothetical protein [Leeuwenhoekiella marinoflava]